MSDRAATIVVYVVTGMWVGNLIAGVLAINGYQPSEAVNGAFMLIVGGAFTARTLKKKDDGSSDGPED